MLVKYRS